MEKLVKRYLKWEKQSKDIGNDEKNQSKDIQNYRKNQSKDS